MNEFDNIKKFPIIIAGTYRSGTTFLGWVFVDKYRLEDFGEAKPQSYDLVKNAIPNCDNKFVLKFVGNQLNEFSNSGIEFTKIWNDYSYKIIIYRKNIIDQVVSYYIAKISKIWNTNNTRYEDDINTSIYSNFPNEINQSKANDVLDELIENYQHLINLKDSADTIISYEEIDFNYKIDHPNHNLKLPTISNIEIVKENLFNYYSSTNQLNYLYEIHNQFKNK